MSSVVQSITEAGLKGTVIDIECHLSNGLPNIIIVGFANKAVDEAKERVRSAFGSSKLDLPRKRITVNLAPADIPKDDTCFDLAISTAILLASEQCKTSLPPGSMLIGELALDGTVRPVRGIIGKLLSARNKGLNNFWIPQANLNQAKLVPNITLFPVSRLNDIYLHLNGMASIKPIQTNERVLLRSKKPTSLSHDFKHVTGQQRAKRAMEIAAAGGHNILLNGPPGTGKSMLARALPSIMPIMSREEVLEVTHLHSLASKQYETIITERPFRSPHHSSSDISIIGGGQNPRPGEISLSHRGVLFFDEFPEFNRSAIEALRQPLEDKVITVARAKDTLSFPANFILVATSNPCPCGYYGSTKSCRCLPHEIIRYQRKLSGPILDRIDIHVTVDEVKHDKLLVDEETAETSQIVANRVQAAREKQQQRYRSQSMTNSDMDNAAIKKLANLSIEAVELLNQAASRLVLSARSYMRAVKVSRTIADLDNSDTIETKHVSEALQYRHTPSAL